MTKTAKALLRMGVSVSLNTDDCRYLQLEELVKIAIANEVRLTLIVGDNITPDELERLALIGRSYLHLDFTKA